MINYCIERDHLLPVKTALKPKFATFAEQLNAHTYKKMSQNKMQQQLMAYQTHVKEESNWKDAFEYLFQDLQSLSVGNDFWKFSCFVFDFCSSKYKNNSYIRDLRSLDAISDINTKAAKEREILNKYYCCSTYIFDHTWVRWTFQFLIMGLYFVLFILLVVYYQDMSFCHHFHPTLKPICPFDQSPTLQDKCWMLRQEDCQVQWTGKNKIDLYTYAQIRISLFCLSFLPYIFLYACMQRYSHLLLQQLNPNIHAHTYSNSIEPMHIRVIFNILFIIVFVCIGFIALVLDGITVQSLKSSACEDTQWGTIMERMHTYDVPTLLLVFNSFTMLWTFIYLAGKFLDWLRFNNVNSA